MNGLKNIFLKTKKSKQKFIFPNSLQKLNILVQDSQYSPRGEFQKS